ncbi:LytR/AlgR family response regulator transcription factor [Tunicatimonas pelagia]|uniref:LytR/AlgR family response regulator transcription factor n=1 Tax=Tunicatimonas pelagia TaxID=931531 RepID=UPI002665A602|nr:LytTR family DNA-binding domain-containing protein [Tunicatimonas pelagia]WKN44730.1 LytTR family DNA-binding domain-containing protein [Tunicatimonas pelagia]
MNQYSCVLVEDNRDQLEELTEIVSSVCQVKGAFSDPTQALSYILRSAPDVIILDHHMPTLSGLDISLQITQARLDSLIIFLTGDRGIAVSAIGEANVIDFVEKPYTPPRVLKAIRKAEYFLSYPTANSSLFSDDHLIHYEKRKGLTKIQYINHRDILYIVSDHNYCNIVTDRGQHLERASISSYNFLTKKYPFFIRYRKGGIVNLLEVTAYNSSELMMSNGDKLAISGSMYGKSFLSQLKEFLKSSH